MGLSPSLSSGRVRVPAVWVQAPVRVLAGFESRPRGFKSQSGFWLGSSPGHMGSSPNLRCTVSNAGNKSTSWLGVTTSEI